MREQSAQCNRRNNKIFPKKKKKKKNARLLQRESLIVLLHTLSTQISRQYSLFIWFDWCKCDTMELLLVHCYKHLSAYFIYFSHKTFKFKSFKHSSLFSKLPRKSLMERNWLLWVVLYILFWLISWDCQNCHFKKHSIQYSMKDPHGGCFTYGPRSQKRTIGLKTYKSIRWGSEASPKNRVIVTKINWICH